MAGIDPCRAGLLATAAQRALVQPADKVIWHALRAPIIQMQALCHGDFAPGCGRLPPQYVKDGTDRAAVAALGADKRLVDHPSVDGLNLYGLWHERAQARQPLGGGPFKPFLSALHRLQQAFPATEAPIRTALVTARSAPAHERVIRTLRAWNIRIDESIFLGGLDKTEFLRAYQADVFFDDQQTHCASASPHIATGHEPHGVANS